MKTKRKIEWNSINWSKIYLRVWRIQTKIYDCSLKNEKHQVIKLQKILVNLFEAKLLAVRKVTQDNRGKTTAGVDGVKSLIPSERLSLVHELKIDGQCNMCGLKFLPGDVIEVDHIKPKKFGGKNSYDNLQLLHGHCHDQKNLKKIKKRGAV